jgi:hypothetical protein
MTSLRPEATPCFPHARHLGDAGRAGDVAAAHVVGQVLHRQLQAVQDLGAGLHPGGDREDATGRERAVGQTHSGDAAVLALHDVLHPGHWHERTQPLLASQAYSAAYDAK